MGFKDTELGKIPLEWELCELKDKVNIVMGQSPKSEFYNKNKEGVPFMQGRTTFGDKYHEIDTWCTEPKRFANKADVLMSVRAPVGDVNIATMKLCIGRGLASLSMKNNNNEYLYYLLKNYVDVITSKGSGTVFSSVNKNDVETLKLPFAGDIEQKAIANILSSLDEKIELNNQMNKTLEEMAQALFKRWFVDFEFPNEDGEPYKSSGGEMVDSEFGMIPKGWEVKSIENICKRIGSGGTPSRKKGDYYGDEILWLKTKELSDSFVFDTEEKITLKGLNESSAKLFPKHTVMMAMYGATVGKLGIISKELSFNQATCGMVVDETMQCYEYLYLWLLKERENIISLATGSAQQNLSVGVIKAYPIIRPSLKQITDFKKVAKGIFEIVENNQEENRNLNSIRDTLLPKLMSGEIRVSDLQN